MTEQINNSNNHLWGGRGGSPAGRWAHSTLVGPAIFMAPTLLTPLSSSASDVGCSGNGVLLGEAGLGSQVGAPLKG